MKKNLKITINNCQNKLRIHPEKIKKLALKIVGAELKSKYGEINICFVDDGCIKRLNEKFLKERCPTDVLAFGICDKVKKTIYGDIMVSTQTAKRNSRIFKTTPGYETELYAAHGILHILGYNDRSQKQMKLMRQKESIYVNP